MSTRETLLDAFRDQVCEAGVASATLEAVAARAGLSKGGLLYHFASKAALVDGLAERLRTLTQANLDRADQDGVARTFLETSIPDEEEARAYWAVFAAVRSGRPDAGDETRRLLVDVFEVWSRRLSQSVGDPVTADLMRLVGDGLYLAAVTGLPLPERERLDAVFDRLVEMDPATQGGADPAGRDAL